MDFPEVDRLIAGMGLSTDPALGNALTISFEPINCFNGCPLGLYFPVDEWSPNVGRFVAGETIILPPDATKGALYHELGHRYGHYYYNNLSEKFAEEFRTKYQKNSRVLLYTGNHFENLPKFGVLFEEGEKGAVEFALCQPLAVGELQDIKSRLYSKGERPDKIYYYGNSEIPILRVEFTRGVDWMVVIGSVVAATLVTTVGIMGYSIYKTAKDSPWMIPFLLFGTMITTIVVSAARQEKVRERLKLRI